MLHPPERSILTIMEPSRSSLPRNRGPHEIVWPGPKAECSLAVFVHIHRFTNSQWPAQNGGPTKATAYGIAPWWLGVRPESGIFYPPHPSGTPPRRGLKGLTTALPLWGHRMDAFWPDLWGIARRFSAAPPDPPGATSLPVLAAARPREHLDGHGTTLTTILDCPSAATRARTIRSPTENMQSCCTPHSESK